MFGAVPASLILEIARAKGAYVQLELDLGTPTWFFIKPEHMCTIPVETHYFSTMGKKAGSLSRVEHPSYVELRKLLTNRGNIKHDGLWGHIVEKPFFLNNHLLEAGEKFPNAGYAGNRKDLTEKYNGGEMLSDYKNYKGGLSEW